MLVLISINYVGQLLSTVINLCSPGEAASTALLQVIAFVDTFVVVVEHPILILYRSHTLHRHCNNITAYVQRRTSLFIQITVDMNLVANARRPL